MKERLMRIKLSDDIIEATESTVEKTAELLQRFNAGEYWEKTFHNDT